MLFSVSTKMKAQLFVLILSLMISSNSLILRKENYISTKNNKIFSLGLNNEIFVVADNTVNHRVWI